MSNEIIENLASKLNISVKSINATLKLLSEGNTIPFIARYRKEATGNLDETMIRAIETEYTYSVNLQKRKEEIQRLIDEKGLLTDELVSKINAATKLVELEDIYRPFKEKKKTKATEAIKMGLEPLAKKIMNFPEKGTIESLASGYAWGVKKSIEGAQYIIAEWISDNASFRKWLKKEVIKNGHLHSKLKKKKEDEKKVYAMYYDFEEPLFHARHYRILAMNRGEQEGILSVSIDFPQEQILAYFEKRLIKNPHSFVTDIVKDAIKDS